MRKKVLILGASRYYSRSLQSARKAGYYVIAIDKNPDSEGFKFADLAIPCDIIDKSSVLKVAIENKIDGIVPVNDYGVPTASYVSQKMGLPGIPERSAELSTNKEEMRKEWSRKGIPCPLFALAETKNEIFEAIEKVGFPCILKPAHGIGGGSRGVIVVREKKEIEKSIEFTQNFYSDKKTLIETFVSAELEHSAEVIIHNGIPNVVAISDKIKSPIPFRVDMNVLYPTIVKETRLQKLKKQISDAVTALEIKTGAAHVELATTENGFILFELGARCGGGGTPEPIVPFVTGIEEFVEIVRILVGDEPKNLNPLCNRGCNYHFLSAKPGIVKSISGVKEVKELEGILDAEVLVKAGDEVSQISVGTQRPGFIIAGAQDRESAFKLGKKAETMIKIEYY